MLPVRQSAKKILATRQLGHGCHRTITTRNLLSMSLCSLVEQQPTSCHQPRRTPFANTKRGFVSSSAKEASIQVSREHHGGKNNHGNRGQRKRGRGNREADIKESQVKFTTDRVLALAKKVEKSMDEKLLQEIQDREFWKEADRTLKWWSQQATAESVETSFDLLDALADISNLAQQPQLSSTILHTKTLHTLVQNWFVAWAAPALHGNHSQPSNVMPPDQMLQRLENYRMQNQTTTRTKRHLRPNLETYQLLMEAAALRSAPSVPLDFNQQLVRNLMNAAKQQPDLQPTVKTVAHILHGWSVRGQVVSLDEIQSVLSLIQELEKDDSDDGITVNGNSNNLSMVELFNKALFALARNNNASAKKDVPSVKKMWSILQWMEFMAEQTMQDADADNTKNIMPDDIHPNIDTYHLVLNGFARAGQGAQAEMVLEAMVHRHLQSVATTDSSGGNEDCQENDSSTNTGKPCTAIKPISKSFTIVISAFGNSEENRAAEKAEGVLRWQQYLNDNQEGPLQGCLEPDTVTYNNVLRAWSWRRSDKAVERCQALRQEMYQRGLQPDPQTFGQSLKAIALSNLPDKGRPAVQVWREMSLHGVESNDYTQNYFDKCVALSSNKRGGSRRNQGRRSHQ